MNGRSAVRAENFWGNTPPPPHFLELRILKDLQDGCL
jgi:hypothetical protein